MKWIGQHIWDFISRFRGEVYLEGIREVTQDHVVGIDADGKLYKQDVSAGDITGVTAGTGLDGGGTSGNVSLSVDVSDFMSNGSDNRILTATGTDAMNAEASFTYDGDTELTIDTTTTGIYGSPTLHLKNTNASIGGPGIRFQKLGKTGADGDLIGYFTFQGLNDADELTSFASLQVKIGDASDGAETGQLVLGANTTIVGDLTGQASTVATISGLAPNTATTAASQPNITTLAGVFTGSANQLLTDDGDGTVTSESKLVFDSVASELTLGSDDINTVSVVRKTHSDGDGGKIDIEAGNAGGTNKPGGDVRIYGGKGTGNAAGGAIEFYCSTPTSSGSLAHFLQGVDMTITDGQVAVAGNITVTGTVDGRDVATDGSKLDGIESGATTDQTQSDINALNITAASCTGNAATATALETARTIGGVSFNGTANINLPGVNTSGNQDTSGNAATATSATSAGTAKNIVGNTNDDVTITSDGEVIVKLDSDNDESNQKFKITDNADATVFYVQEDGNVFLAGTVITNSSSDNDLTLETDGSLTFTIDRDNDETSQKFSFVNYNTEIANLDESGNLNFHAGGVNNGTITATRRLFLQHGSTYDVSIGDATNTDVLQVQGSDQKITVNGTIELGNASDTTIARSAAGKVSIEGNEIQTKNVHHHFIHAGFFMNYPYSRYIPLNGSISEQTTSTLAPEYTTFIWPYDGYVKTMWVRSETSLGSTEMKLYKGANGSTVSTAMGAVTETVGANTSVEFDMTGVTNSFSQGEAMAVRIDPTDDPDSGQNVTIECVFDLTT